MPHPELKSLSLTSPTDPILHEGSPLIALPGTILQGVEGAYESPLRFHFQASTQTCPILRPFLPNPGHLLSHATICPHPSHGTEPKVDSASDEGSFIPQTHSFTNYLSSGCSGQERGGELPSCLSRRLKIPIYLSQCPSSPCWESRDVPPSEDSSQPQGPAWEGPASPVRHLPWPGLSPAWPAQWAGRTHSSHMCLPAPTVPANPGQAGNDWGRDRK